ncbi:hypothetical protein OG320_00765 [Microbispora sp. NBC_01189]|uniref:hypothetical protein n=1 Tax=Microbispora sp. NBC_01189 TaxID=2903583 RepID=UPI002E124F0C|nr:hypothetical protein OG320_00765 [Microbispora sp. NBC_01189]
MSQAVSLTATVDRGADRDPPFGMSLRQFPKNLAVRGSRPAITDSADRRSRPVTGPIR